MRKITAYIEKDFETALYVAIVPGIPGAHTQAETLDELQENLKEVIELCLEDMDLWEILCFLGRARTGIKKPMEIIGLSEEEFASENTGTFIGDEVKSKGVEVV